MINLVQFLNTQASDAKEQRHAATDNSMIDADQLRGSELIRAAEERYDQVQGKQTEKMPSCIEKPETVLKVNLRLSYLSAVFIHP